MFARLVARWATFVFRHPFLILIISLAIAIFSAYLGSNIALKSDFASLLPEDVQSVKDLKAISKRMGGMGTLIISVEGKNLKAMERFADDLVTKLRQYPREEVRFVDYKVDRQKEFFDRNKFLYLKEDELKDLYTRMDQRIKDEKLKANPLFIDLEDDEDEEEDEDGDAVFDFHKEADKYKEKSAKFDKYIDGYLTNEDGSTLLVVVKTPGTGTGVNFARRMIAKVDEEVRNLDPKKYDSSMEVFFTGDLQTLVEEYHALRDDIVWVSNLCVALVLLAVALYYRSIRMTAILSVGLLAGVAVTMGLTYLAIGYLTAATAFLASIVAGNGINFGIYFLARYMEERQKEEPINVTLANAINGTIKSVSTAAFAAGASYISLMATEFRGFNQFGFIGGTGMVICLLFALTLDPALIVLMERYYPFKKERIDRWNRGRIFSGAAAWLVEGHAKKIFIAGIVMLVISTIALGLFLRDPFEYQFKKLRNQYSRDEGSGARSTAAEKIMGERSSPHVILADSMDQVTLIKDALQKYTDENPDPQLRVIKNIKTIWDYKPGTDEEQERKLVWIAKIRELIENNNFDFLKDEDRKLVKDLTPPDNLKIVQLNDIPDEILRLYIEDNGKKGTPVYVYMADGMSVWNGKDLERFADVVREVDLGDAKVRSSGHSVIFTDMIRYVADEGPWATLGAFLLVTIVIIMSFRKTQHIFVLASSMAAGVLLMMGVAVLTGQKINFLNYIAIPIQFGIGVDYSVNLYSRFLEEGRGSIGRVLRSTGGAVMITSSTTIIGYGALWFSINGAINSFGWLANIGEVTCLATAVLMMSSYLALFRHGLDKAGDKK